MTDQIGNNPSGEATPAPAQVAGEVANQPSTITKEDLDNFRNEIKQELAKVYQGVQSRTDKFSEKMQRKMEALESAAKAAGVQLTDNEKQMYQAQAKLEILNQEASQPDQFNGQQPGQATPQGLTDAEIAATNAAADAKFKVAGIEIKRGDPEDAIIAAAEDKTPQEYLAAVDEAIKAYQSRKGVSPPPQPTPQTATNLSPGLVKGTALSNPIENINDPDELWKRAKTARG